MADVSVAFAVGSEQVTVVLPVDLPAGGPTPLIGDVSGTFGDCFITGDINLTGDLIITGLLTGIDTFYCQGNGFSVFFEQGGRADLHGVVKAAWGSWGADATGWAAGDRVAVAPTSPGIFEPALMTWTGDWVLMPRPPNSPDVTLPDGTVAKPEVVNLEQSIVFENLSRGWHIHGSGGVFDVSDVKLLNCGTTGVFGNYPVHFHEVGDNSRGSTLTRVVVEGGKNHAFVPHGSHGITFKDCAAVNSVDDAFWWDFPVAIPPNPQFRHTANNSDDTDWDHCLVLGLTGSSHVTRIQLAGFILGAGSGNRVVDCAAAAVDGGTSGPARAGFRWPEPANNNEGGTVWESHHLTSHNLGAGFVAWQNDGQFDPSHVHEVTDLVAYNCTISGVDHGAYLNMYKWRRMVLGPNVAVSIASHASPLRADGDILFEDFAATAPFKIFKHRADENHFQIVRGSCPSVIVEQTLAGDSKPARYRFEDTGLTPADFTFITSHAGNVFHIVEAGTVVHTYQSGVWT